MQEPGLGDYWGRLFTGREGNDTRAPPEPHGRRGWASKHRDSQIFVRGAWHALSYLGARSLGPLSPTFFSTSSKKKDNKNHFDLPDREASLIKKEYCRLSASPQVTPSRARPHPPREGRPIGTHPWDPGVNRVPGQTSPHCTVGACLRTEGLAR